MCGIFAVCSEKEILADLISAIGTLQHRGQDAVGLVTFDRTFHIKKESGLADHRLKGSDITHLKGKMGMAHLRYTTQGSTDLYDAQPFTVHYPLGLALVHNGNITNFEQLKEDLIQQHHHLIESSNDAELLLYMLALELKEHNLRDLKNDHIFSAVHAVQEKVQGAYAALTLIANKGLLAFMDPHAIRPLTLGKKETEEGIFYALASESRTLDYLGYELIHHLQAGEVVFIDKNMRVHSRICKQEKNAFCVFEYIYFSKEDTVHHNKTVAEERIEMGKRLARHLKDKNLNPDIIIDVPSSGYFFAQGLSDALSTPYKKGLIKSDYAKRSFISPTQTLRERIVRHKCNPIKWIVDGQKVAVVDDSIVRGTTSRHIVRLLKNAGAKEVYFISGSPPIVSPCVYGIDMSHKKEMIAATSTIEEIQAFIEADALIYPTVEEMREMYKDIGICDACFTKEYPTKISEKMFQAIEQDKQLSMR